MTLFASIISSRPLLISFPFIEWPAGRSYFLQLELIATVGQFSSTESNTIKTTRIWCNVLPVTTFSEMGVDLLRVLLVLVLVLLLRAIDSNGQSLVNSSNRQLHYTALNE